MLTNVGFVSVELEGCNTEHKHGRKRLKEMEMGECLCLVWLVSLYDVHNSKIGTRKIPRQEGKAI
jgi:hypothetical protein